MKIKRRNRDYKVGDRVRIVKLNYDNRKDTYFYDDIKVGDTAVIIELLFDESENDDYRIQMDGSYDYGRGITQVTPEDFIELIRPRVMLPDNLFEVE